MDSSDNGSKDWARAQLKDAKVSSVVTHGVLHLYDAWRALNYPITDKSRVLTIFNKLAKSEALIDEERDEVWVRAKPGFISIRDQVRVASDAYSGPIGQAHNGRRGVVVAMRHGDVIVRYTDNRKPEGGGVHHSPFALEKLVPS